MKQREILFRGYDQEREKMVYGWYTKLVEGIRIIDAIITLDEDEDRGLLDSQYIRYYIHNPETITQYTGVNDVKGKRIFEADIVRLNHDNKKLEEYGVIRFVDSEWQIIITERCYMSLKFLYKEQLEIIGDFFQNPELVEKYKLEL